jgi:hypothetical protein
MGEYARQYALEQHGVDIGDDDDRPRKPKPPRIRCPKCGKHFKSEQAVRDHTRDYHDRAASKGGGK